MRDEEGVSRHGHSSTSYRSQEGYNCYRDKNECVSETSFEQVTTVDFIDREIVGVSCDTVITIENFAYGNALDIFKTSVGAKCVHEMRSDGGNGRREYLEKREAMYQRCSS